MNKIIFLLPIISVFLGVACIPAVSSAATVNVSITDAGYVPELITIQAGDTVVWTNNASGTLSVASDPHETHDAYPPLNLGTVAKDAQVSLSFPYPGTYGYHEHIYDVLEGTIIVVGRGIREPDPPVFGNFAVSHITPTSAVIDWTTERGSYTRFEYGTTSNRYDTLSSEDPMLITKHRAEVVSLSPNTTYYYHAIGGMADDQKIYSDQFHFKTLPLPAVIPLAPPTPDASAVAPVLPPQEITPTMPAMDMSHMDMSQMLRPSMVTVRTVHASSFSQNLRFGDKGESVKNLQDWLIRGKFLAAGLNTARFGLLTKNAVIRYQAKHEIPQTGFFGPATRKMIQDMGE